MCDTKAIVEAIEYVVVTLIASYWVKSSMAFDNVDSA